MSAKGWFDKVILSRVATSKAPGSGQADDLGFFGELWRQVRLVFYLIKDRDVPIYLKVLPFLGIFYILFPIDFITDFVPVLGQLDDLTVLVIGLKVFIEMAPAQVVERYLSQMRGDATGAVIEGQASDVTAAPILIEGEIVDEPEAVKQAEKVGKER
jgi:uncharacterized membrane protein YkvA (DUF1232 family)